MESIQDFFNGLSEAEFDAKFLELAHSEAFSAVASGVGLSNDFIELWRALVDAGIDPEWVKNYDSMRIVVREITDRIMKKKDA